MDENNQEVKIDTRKVIRISKRKFKVTIVIIVVLILIFLGGVIFLGTFGRFGISNTMGPESLNSSDIPYIPQGSSDLELIDRKEKMMVSSPDIYNSGYEQPSISDTREFLKTDYSSTIKTRDVSDVVKEVKNIVKGSDGRIDNSNSSEKSGSISFVIPKSKFETFKDEMESITHKKLYFESITEQNLLTEKQGIEQQTTNIVNTLENLKTQKEALLSKHTQAVSSINKELARIKAELIAVRAVIAKTTDAEVMISLRSQEASLVKQDTTQRQLLNTENSTYATQNQNLENLINNQNNNLINVNQRDSQFTDNIETVNGTIYVEWVSLWQMAKIFSPIHPTLIIIILIIIIWIYSKRKGYIPRVELQ